MSKTVIGIFDSARDAQEAVSRLSSAGIDRDRVDVANRADTSTSVDRNDDNDTSFGDSISSFFSNLFGDDDDAKKYSEVAKRGYTITVHANTTDEADRAAEILDNTGAIDVDERATQISSGHYNSTSDYNTSHHSNLVGDRDINITDRDRDLDITNRSIPVIEENLEVGKREVQSGGARLHSRIVERPVEEHIRLRSERVNVERTPVNREATSADFDTFKEGTIELTERQEVPIVNKEARVVEEVSLNKQIEETEETIRDTVRKTEIDVENLSDDEIRRRRDSSSYNDTSYNRDDNRTI
ncbi:YsnF/AvaK domain-containing protein [Desertivirga brevis]|uniref:YsnF/AvaK domain-containing protein n=1 Tax=Desertivirga brevis TaxID=2810310 RepID=UPI001A97A98F|nr:YsnF/AvaK domain-containing protein [Pedobacter sp. SYSU D00873]